MSNTLTRHDIQTKWREINELVSASSYLLQHADCNGPLADLPTADPAVRVVMAARRHLLNRAGQLRKEIFV